MKKIGLVNIDTSHPQGFSAIMAQNAELDMQYTAEVKLCELDDGDKFDGYAFEEFYASTSKPIYLK